MTISEWKKLKEGQDIFFKGKKYTLIEDIDGKTDTSLCTEEQYDNFEPSDGHIYWNDTESKILRHRIEIGSIKDISI